MTQTEVIDIFHWANKIDSLKQDLDIELFFFNKNYTPYSLNFSKELDSQIRSLFLLDILNYINLGAGTGLVVQLFESFEPDDNILLTTKLEKVIKAQSLLDIIKTQKSEIVEFSQQEHEFKRIKGVVAKFSDKSGQVFYSIKLINQTAGVFGPTAWQLSDGKFRLFQPEVALKMPNDNQVLIVKDDIFIFNQSKFERLFNYNFKKQLVADKKITEIEKKFRLSFPDGLDLRSLIQDRQKSINKLQKTEIGDISQEQVVDYCDQMQLELMTDDSGAIIIMDGGDLDIFLNLINEDYVTSQLTGRRYEVKSKKPLGEPEGEPPRG